MGVFSKLLFSLPYNCYEIAHPYTPYCTDSWVFLFLSCFRKSAKLYGLLYMFSQIVSRKFTTKALVDTLQSTLTSTVFLSYNMFYFLFFICFFRWVLGRLYLHQSTLGAGIFSSFLAIFLERPNRRRVLSVYMLNLSSEIIFRMLENRNMVKRVMYGEILMFAFSSALFVYCMQVNKKLRDPMSSALRFLLGKEEFTSNSSVVNGKTCCDKINCDNSFGGTLQKPRFLDVLFTSHSSCHHKNGCIQNGLQGLAFTFLVGYSARVAIQLISSFRVLQSQPHLILSIFRRKQSLMPGLFLGGYVGIYRILSCSLRWSSNGQKHWHSIPAGFFAGLSMLAFPSPSLSLYFFWKLVEVLYCQAINEGYAPSFSLAPAIIYAFSCGIMLFNAVLEPHNLRSSYLKFLNDMSGDRLREVNRHPIEPLGFHATQAFPDYFPQLDHKFITRSFIERVLVWS